MPKLSIITVCYNEIDSIESTITSVLIQSFKDYQYIVMDGGSNDGTVSILENYADIIDIIRSEPDNGIYHAMNKGLTLAEGAYVYFLNGGDKLHDKNTLSNIFKCEFSEDIVYGDLLMVDSDGSTRVSKQPDQVDIGRFLVSSMLHPATFVKRELFYKYGYFREEFTISSDYELFIRFVLKYGASTKRIPIIVSVFNTLGITSRPETFDARQMQRRQIQKEYFPPHYYLMARVREICLRHKDFIITRLALRHSHRIYRLLQSFLTK